MNKQKLTVLVDSGFNDAYKKFLELRFDLTVLHMKDYEKFDRKQSNSIGLLLFTGGADVNPEMYNESVGKQTHINNERDRLESDIYYRYDYIPKLGICRGSQFLTVMSGGKLIQHVEGHLGTHKIHVVPYNSKKIMTGQISTYNMTSTHHQMMYPFNLRDTQYKIIGWADKFRSTRYLNGNNEEISLPSNFLEPEIVRYNNSNSLCVQGHPEFKDCPEQTKNLILSFIENLIQKEKENNNLEVAAQWR